MMIAINRKEGTNEVFDLDNEFKHLETGFETLFPSEVQQ